MIQVSNLQFHNDLPFDEYLALSGYSFSGLKAQISGEVIKSSTGMQIGTRVHNYLLEPEKYDGVDYDTVTKVAAKLRENLGPAIKFLLKEQAFTATFMYDGYEMQYKGRADLLLPGKLVIDLKILSGDLQPAINRFNYGEQLTGYALATGCMTSIIISFNKKNSKVESRIIPKQYEFWMHCIKTYGTPIH